MEEVNLNKIKTYLYITAFLQFQGFIGPVLFVFYTKYMGLTTSEYLFVDALLFFVMAIFEIPSGFIADYFGRKRVLIISKIIITTGMIILLVENTFGGAVIVAIIYGLFGSMESGICETIIYENYEKYNRIEEYEYINAKVGSIGFVTSIAYSTIAGYLINRSIVMPIVLDIGVSIILIFAVLLLIEDNSKLVNKEVKIPSKKECFNILPIVAVASFLLSCSRVICSFFQPILIQIKISTYWFGIISAMYSVSAAFGAAIYKKIRSNISEKAMFGIIIFLHLISTVGIIFFRSYFVVFFMVLSNIQRGLMGPFLYIKVNAYICSDKGNRATLLSIYFFVTTILTAVMLFGVSKLTKIYELDSMILIYSLIVNLIITLLDIILLNMIKNNKLIEYVNN